MMIKNGFLIYEEIDEIDRFYLIEETPNLKWTLNKSEALVLYDIPKWKEDSHQIEYLNGNNIPIDLNS